MLLTGSLLMWIAASPDAGSPGEVRIPREALVEDVRQLAGYLDSAHPDPYAGPGGRVLFQREMWGVMEGIPAEGLPRAAFLRLLRPWVASLQDGHTSLSDDSQRAATRRAAVELEAIQERLYVSGVYRESDRSALKGRIRAVAGVPWQGLVARMARFRGSDNAYNNLAHLAAALESPEVLRDFLGAERTPEALALELELPGGVVTRTFPFEAGPRASPLRPPTQVNLPPVNAADLGWGFLDAKKEVAILRIDSMMRYREAFEQWRTTGYSGALGSYLDETARLSHPGPLPDGADARIALIPSATETLQALFRALRENHSKRLVIDLRRNEGGNSVLAEMVAYFLYPMQRLLETDEGYQIARFSQLYLDTHSGDSLEAIRARTGMPLAVGDFDFSEERAWRARKEKGLDDAARRKLAERFDGLGSMVPTFQKAMREGRWNASWSGEVVAVTSAETYSAAFDLVILLVKNGARVVGVPPAQAGNCFIDNLPFRLAHSGIRGGLSYKRSLAFPEDPLRGRMLRPDIELTEERWKKLGSDPNSAVRLAGDAQL